MGPTKGTRRLSMGLASVVGTALMVLAGCGDEPETTTVIRPVKTMVLDSAASAVRRSYPGTVQASQRAVMAFKVAGPLVEISVREGQEVEEGTVLARIDPRDFKTRLADATSSLVEAQATLRAMETARPEDIKLLEARLAAAAATFKEAEAQLKRNQVLVKDKVVTQAEFDQIVAAHDVAKAKMEAANENLQKAKAGARKEDVEAMQARIEGLRAQVESAQNAFDDTFLKAPFAGIVAATFVENFEKVEAKQSILLMQDIENIEIIINVPENVVATAKRQPDAKLTALFEALPDQEFTVTLKEFSTEADSATQTYKATLTMPTPVGANIFPGMTCTAIHYVPVSGEEEGSQFTIPAAAVIDEEGKQYAWVIDSSDTTHRRQIQVGDLVGANIRVLDGLRLGETIAISGAHFLREGMEVRKLGTEIGDQLK